MKPFVLKESMLKQYILRQAKKLIKETLQSQETKELYIVVNPNLKPVDVEETLEQAKVKRDPRFAILKIEMELDPEKAFASEDEDGIGDDMEPIDAVSSSIECTSVIPPINQSAFIDRNRDILEGPNIKWKNIAEYIDYKKITAKWMKRNFEF